MKGVRVMSSHMCHLLGEMFTCVCVRAETQPKDLWLDDNRTPDIDLILGGRKILVDVAVVHPSAPSYVVEARNPLGGSATMVLTKEEKYAKLADSLGAEVVPAIIETYGPPVTLFSGSSRTSPSTRRPSRTLYGLQVRSIKGFYLILLWLSNAGMPRLSWRVLEAGKG